MKQFVRVCMFSMTYAKPRTSLWTCGARYLDFVHCNVRSVLEEGGAAQPLCKVCDRLK